MKQLNGITDFIRKSFMREKIMRWLINYIRSCFCKHDCELIHDGGYFGNSIHCKVYRCKKCGYSKKYKSF